MGASRKGILAIDAVIKRWIAYDEAASAQPQLQPPSAPVPEQRRGLQRKTVAAGGVKMHDRKARPAGATVATAAATTGPATATKPRSVSAITASATATGTASATATKPKERFVSAGTGAGPKKQQQKQR